MERRDFRRRIGVVLSHDAALHRKKDRRLILQPSGLISVSSMENRVLARTAWGNPGGI